MGALILTLPIDHPDIEEFIEVKTDLSAVNFANISIMITDDFMEAVKNDEDWTLKFDVKSTGEKVRRVVSAKELFRKIAAVNWDYAEPGMLFWDRVENYHMNSENDDFKFSATNPCAELPLSEGGSCLLSSINLSEYVINPFSEDSKIDYHSLRKDIPEIVRFMDDVLEEGIQYLPLEHQRRNAEEYRQIGIGTMGLADMLIKLGLTYGDLKGNMVTEELMSMISDTTIKSSALLAKERGSYPKYNDSVLDTSYINTVAHSETKSLIKKHGLRNGQLLSIAPNGSISTLMGVSGGIEPIFALSHTRRSESLGDGEDVFYEVHADIVQQYIDATGNDGELPPYFITSHEIDYEKRVVFQGIVQRYIDNAISSTVNLPKEATIDDVEDLYILAWENGLKGITVFRDGCARLGILTTNDKDTNPDDNQEEFEDCST